MNAKNQPSPPDGTIPKIVSEPALKRLPLYHRFLKEWQTAGRETVSCTDIGLDLDLDPTQVRKDLESVGVVGFAVDVGFGVGDDAPGWQQTLPSPHENGRTFPQEDSDVQ